MLVKKKLVECIYSEAKVEGINVTFHETETIINGINVPNLKLDDFSSILNLKDAWKFVIDTINCPVNIDYICKVNSFVSRNESLEWGKLRNGKVGISGTSYIPDIPVKEEIEKELNEIMKIQNNAEKALKYSFME